MRETKKTKFYSNSKGITLIALVITIIVLLLLAGVSISMLSGENGILKQANEAKIKNEEAAIEEQIRLAQLEAAMNLDGITHTETLSSIGNKEVNVTIPSGFTLSPREGEQNIETGMVIIDSEGNEYVWIPVFEYDATNCTWGVDYSEVRSKTEGSDEYYIEIQSALKTYTTEYVKSGYSDQWFGNEEIGKYGYYAEEDTDKTNLICYSNGNMSETEYETLYHNMLNSVYKNGGFYIGRYEMGTAVVNSTEEAQENSRTEDYIEYCVSDNNETNEKPTINGMTVTLSKANAVPCNYITQSQAQMLAESLNYSSAKSSLLFGVQWNMVCVFIEHYDERNEATTTSEWLKTNDYSNLWGNYKNSEFKLDRGYYTTNYRESEVTWKKDYNIKKDNITEWLCTTGASDNNKALNIYDFAGNASEWTLEMYSGKWGPLVSKGGHYCYNGYVTASSTSETKYSGTWTTSARTSLYIK